MYLLTAILIGIICGFVPAAIGAVREELETGMLGFILSVVSASIAGFYAAVPTALLFTLLIIKRTAAKRSHANIIPFPKSYKPVRMAKRQP